ncbi:MAG: hypothetical protein QME25_03300 [Bacteroidota bacterium]|nr:hypothetical protein [Bacteroidota bacterium]
MEEKALFPILEKHIEGLTQILREEHILFPLLKKYLTKDELKTVARKMVI